MKRLALALSLIGGVACGQTPVVKAESAVVLDAFSGKVLWSKNPDVSRFPASTTKIMTALLVIEKCNLDDIVTAPPDIEKIKEASLHLKPGEQLKVRDLLYAILLRSGNDACYAAAKHIGGTATAFVDMMNARAKQIGCTNTHFHNPNGLMDQEHTTTARDLAIMGREAMKNETFASIVKVYKKQINRSINWQDTWMINHNKWLLKDKTADGIKTGYTKPAGNCFVGSATRNGFRVITSLLKSDKASWQNDHKAMIEWAFANYRMEGPISNATANLSLSEGRLVHVEMRDTVGSLVPKNSLMQVSLNPVPLATPNLAAIKKGEKVTDFEYRDSTGFTWRVPAYATEDVDAAPKPGIIGVGSRKGFSFFAIAGLLGGLAYLNRRKARSIKFQVSMEKA